MSKNKKKKENPSTPLEQYRHVGKELTPPFATLDMQPRSWINERLPEMVWAALIRAYHADANSLAIFRDILRWLEEQKAVVDGVTLTDIANYDNALRTAFIERVVTVAGTDALRPLLILPDLPAYNDWKDALHIEATPEEKEADWSHLAGAVLTVMDHQSQEATDCRWVKLMGTILTGKLHLPREIYEELNQYPNYGDQRAVRPTIRSTEMTMGLTEPKYQWANKFWDYCYTNTTCMPQSSEAEIERKQREISKHKEHYTAVMPGVREALVTHFLETSKTTAIDARHEAVFGIALYGLDVFIENILFLTAATTNGRVSARIILEAYLTLAYLLYKETAGELLWDTYRNYGVGQISLIERKYEDQGYSSAMVDIKKMDAIANEDKWSEFVPINLGHWDVSNLRKISTEIGEKELYDKYYDYTSGYAHVNWGAVREAALQSCYNPLHRLHRIPAFSLPILPNVNDDCREFVNKVLALVDNAYPSFKERITEPLEAQTEEHE